MPGCPQSIPPGPLDLSRYSEATRRHLYDNLSRTEFSVDAVDYSAEEAGLLVFFFSGRWFALWNRLEVPVDAPEAARVELLRISSSAETDWGYMLHEV